MTGHIVKSRLASAITESVWLRRKSTVVMKRRLRNKKTIAVYVEGVRVPELVNNRVLDVFVVPMTIAVPPFVPVYYDEEEDAVDDGIAYDDMQQSILLNNGFKMDALKHTFESNMEVVFNSVAIMIEAFSESQKVWNKANHVIRDRMYGTGFKEVFEHHKWNGANSFLDLSRHPHWEQLLELAFIAGQDYTH